MRILLHRIACLALLVLALCPAPVDANGEAQAQTQTCFLEPGRNVCGEGLICDGIRMFCVPDCSGEGCCSDVTCPEGAACVPGRGICGIPVGAACYDLGPGWSSVRLNPRASVPDAARPVQILVENRSGAPLYFAATTAAKRPRFDLYAPQADGRRLEIPENQFCPTACPAEGPIPEIDCGRPEPGAVALAEGAELRLNWSGLESVTRLRACAERADGACIIETPAYEAHYEIEICAFAALADGPVPGSAAFAEGARVSGPDRCLRSAFDYPEQGAITLSFRE